MLNIDDLFKGRHFDREIIVLCVRWYLLDGYQASHRAAKEALEEHPEGNQREIRSSKYVNNLIEQDHRSIKVRLGPMLGLKHFRRVATTIAGIEVMHRIRKGQFKLGKIRVKNKTAPEIWNAVLAA